MKNCFHFSICVQAKKLYTSVCQVFSLQVDDLSLKSVEAAVLEAECTKFTALFVTTLLQDFDKVKMRRLVAKVWKDASELGLKEKHFPDAVWTRLQAALVYKTGLKAQGSV